MPPALHPTIMFGAGRMPGVLLRAIDGGRAATLSLHPALPLAPPSCRALPMIEGKL
jgi:hypothetical protein